MGESTNLQIGGHYILSKMNLKSDGSNPFPISTELLRIAPSPENRSINEDVSIIIPLLLKYNVAYDEKVTYYYHIRPNSISTGSGKKRMGESCIVLYNDILYNLTEGQEKVELRGLMYSFGRRYANCISAVPQLTETIDLYKERSFRYSCLYVYFVLTMLKVVCHICNPLPILNMLNTARWRMKRLFF